MPKKKVVIEIDSVWFGVVDDVLRLIRRVCDAEKIPVKIDVEVE